jgi:hypothetical protein
MTALADGHIAGKGIMVFADLDLTGLLLVVNPVLTVGRLTLIGSARYAINVLPQQSHFS